MNQLIEEFDFYKITNSAVERKLFIVFGRVEGNQDFTNRIS